MNTTVTILSVSNACQTRVSFKKDGKFFGDKLSNWRDCQHAGVRIIYTVAALIDVIPELQRELGVIPQKREEL